MLFRVYTCAVLITFLLSSCETFILDGTQCSLPKPCICGNNYITCNSLPSTIPPIYPISHSITKLTLSFRYGNIGNIPSSVFLNVSSANASSIDLLLDESRIANISEQAFNGIENAITTLDLRENELTWIPAAIGHLKNLQMLYLQGNPLRTITANVLIGIQRSLRAFDFSLGHLTSWPMAINILRHIKELTLDQIVLKSLPNDAFSGFETTLETISIFNTILERMPKIICNMKNLHILNFGDNNIMVEHITFQDFCQFSLNRVKELYILNDNITDIPNGLFKFVPNLKILDLSYNQIQYISTESVPISSCLTTLYLDDNSLVGIPFALNRLEALELLSLRNNQIHVLEHNDLTRLHHLITLDLSNNPLLYVDSSPFESQQSSLQRLYFGSTPLDTIPIAVTTVENLNYLEFYQSPSIECSCDKMAYLRSWNVTGVQLDGYCDNSQENIKDFLTKSLPSCPVT